MENTKKNKSLIGDKEFYKLVLGVAIPIMIQNGISNFVSLLDNLMIGQVGTNAISGVAISNQLIFVYYLLVFGASAGIGIFTAQYYGIKDHEGVRYTFRAKVVINLLITLLSVSLLFIFGDLFISLFLKGEGNVSDVEATLKIGRSYLNIMLIGLIPNAVTQAYAGTLRETGETKVPMYAAFIAVFINLIGNYLLIYGHLGLPELKADGAAIATVISRFVELIILIAYTQKRKDKHPFIIGAFKNFTVPTNLWGKFLVKSLPLMLNEGIWSLGVTTLNQCYSYRSLSAVAAINIEVTLYNLLGVAFLAMGDAVGILVGQVLGTGDMKKAMDYARKLTAFTVFCGVIFSIGMAAISPFFPLLYNTTSSIRHLATNLILINALFMPTASYLHASYFVIRSGGRTGITLLFDSGFMLLISVPLAYFLSRYTSLSVLIMMTLILSADLIKCAFGYIMVKKGIWMRNLVKEE
ncbi:MAG: MATE family efflux transporter [Lachnospiraceae bacterium]|nr:MATE family efflux transporter [Lachnospiraceae bacterium]